jgi:hypothetical protein
VSIVCARFFDLFACPKKASPHHCGLPWAILCDRGRAGSIEPAVTFRAMMDRTRPAPASAEGAQEPCVVNRPPQRDKGRTHMRIDLAPTPQPTPRRLCLHIFCNLCVRVYALGFTVGGAPPFFFLAAVCKSCANKGVAKETSSLMPWH